MHDTDLPAEEIRRAIDREVDLVTGAIDLVASGGAPSAMVAGLRLTDQVMAIVSPLAADRGVILEALWSADESTAGIRVSRDLPR